MVKRTGPDGSAAQRVTTTDSNGIQHVGLQAHCYHCGWDGPPRLQHHNLASSWALRDLDKHLTTMHPPSVLGTLPQTELQALWFVGGEEMAQHALIWYASGAPAYTEDIATVWVKACMLTHPRPSRPLIIHATGFEIDYAELAETYGVDDLDGVQLVVRTQDALNELRQQHPQ